MLQIHRASRGDGLADALAEVLRAPVGDPFTPEIVAVPTRGVERWLSQRLSAVLGAAPGREDGVCANVEFPFPATLVGAALAATTGVDPAEDPWLPERAVWPLLAVVDQCLEEPWLAPLADHLGTGSGDDRGSRRFATVRHLADLFDRYGVHRPALLRGWAAGDDPPEGSDGAWQAELWRRLRSHVGVPGPAERLDVACARVAANPESSDLPERLSLFGLTRLPASYLDVLVALAAGRAVHLWLLHPSAALWDRVAAAGTGSALDRRSHRSPPPANPLLGTWARDAREMQAVLTAAGAHGGHAVADPQPPPTLLGRLQSDIRADREPPPLPAGAPAGGAAAPAGGAAARAAGEHDRRPVLDGGDRSVQVHACHGRARQVEVLRDAIVHLLAADATLEPRDVIVMCPDIEAFAPLIHATFGPGREVAGADLHVRLADRSLRQTNPVLGGLARLLELAAGRVTASDLLDLAGTAPVRCRFGFDDDELARVDTWVRDAGVRWGLDAPWRRPYRLEGLADGTWASGLDRVLAGVAMSEEPYALVGGVLPLDDVDSGDIDLAGRMAEMVERTADALRAFAAPHTLDGWVEAIGAATEALLASPVGQEWQQVQLRRLIDDVAAQASAAGGLATPLAPEEVRALLADRLRGVPTRANFRTGHLTMCTLVPMRSVPHRVVCLLGMDDGAFPRRTTPDSDDLLAADPHLGDRDPRSEDRQLLLDAVLAAGDTLVITYSGRDERTNAPLPPAVPIGELLDVVDRTVRGADGGAARGCVVTRHPLQPFDERCFTSGELVAGAPWSFDRTALHGALAARRPRAAAPGSALALVPGQVLAAVRPDPLVLDDLVRFVEHPVKAFLRQRLGVTVRGEWREPGDAVAIELDALERWKVGDRLLASRLAGVGGDACVSTELARGSLPPGRLGRRVLDDMAPAIEALVAAAAAPARTPQLLDVAASAGGVTVAGTVAEVYGDELRTVTYSRLAGKHRLAAWVRLLALTASAPEHPWTARSLGRAARGDGVSVAVIAPLGSDAASRRARATEELSVIVDLYLRGMREPLPLAPKTAAAWASAAGGGEEAARRAWVTKFDAPVPSEDQDPAHWLVHGGPLDWEDYIAPAPHPDEAAWGGHRSRAGCLAERLWSGLLRAEVLQAEAGQAGVGQVGVGQAGVGQAGVGQAGVGQARVAPARARR